MKLKLDTIQSEAILSSISQYLSPEMSILVSGIGFSSIPFPWRLFENFRGCFHEFIDGYLHKYCINDHLSVQTTVKLFELNNTDKVYDLAVFGQSNTTLLSDLSKQKSSLKEGGYLLYIYEKENRITRELFLEEDFELIEESQFGGLFYFLVKKGWDIVEDIEFNSHALTGFDH